MIKWHGHDRNSAGSGADFSHERSSRRGRLRLDGIFLFGNVYRLSVGGALGFRCQRLFDEGRLSDDGAVVQRIFFRGGCLEAGRLDGGTAARADVRQVFGTSQRSGGTGDGVLTAT